MPQPRMVLAAVALSLGIATAASAAERPLPLDAIVAHEAAPAASAVRPDPVPTRVGRALEVLSRRVERQSHPHALRLAFQAYFGFREAHPERVRKPYLYYVDYGLDSRTPRGYVFDMESLEVVEGPFTVAHGRGSTTEPHGVPTRFTNAHNSASTSLGLFVAQETYAFSGRSGGQRYHSIGLRLNGVSGAFNSAARARGIVVHGAPYVTADRAGRSEGCPAMEEERAQRLIPRISNGALVFLFSPLDTHWLQKDPWLRGSDRPGILAR